MKNRFKIIILFIILASIVMVGCKNDKIKNNIVFEKYNVLIKKDSLKNGTLVSGLITQFELEDLKIINTNYKLTIDIENNDLKYEISCAEFNSKEKKCSKSIEKIKFIDKEVIINENDFSNKNEYSKKYEKFLTYLKLLNDNYLLSLTNSDGFNENGNLTIHNMHGIEILKEENVTTVYIMDNDIKSNLYPKLEDNKIYYYVCDINENLIIKKSIELETLKINEVERYSGTCNVKQEYFNK